MTSKHLTLSAIALVLMAVPAYAKEKKAAEPVAPVAEETVKPAEEEVTPTLATEAAGKTEEEAGKAEKHVGAEGASSSHHAKIELPDVDWSFSGPFGTYDKAALQRGFLVYKQVCSACHSMNKLYYRNLGALGYSDAQIKTIAAEYTVMDGPNDEGEMFERPARPSDKFKSPYPNEKAAAFVNGGALPPDLSLITKARKGGANYVYGILTGYEDAPAGFQIGKGQHYNKVKDGNIIAMAAPLNDGAVPYEDGSVQTVDQYAKDVSQFLTWAAEPEMEHRKQMGIKVLIFLSIFALIMYAVKRKVWENVR